LRSIFIFLIAIIITILSFSYLLSRDEKLISSGIQAAYAAASHLTNINSSSLSCQNATVQTKPEISVFADRNLYSDNDVIRIYGYTYNSNCSNHASSAVVIIKVIRIEDKNTSNLLSLLSGNNGYYNATILAPKPGTYQVSATTIGKDDSSQYALTGFEIQQVWYSKSAWFLYLAIVFFMGLILLILFKPKYRVNQYSHRKNLINWVVSEIRKRSERRSLSMDGPTPTPTPGPTSTPTPTLAQHEKNGLSERVEALRFVCLSGIAFSIIAALYAADEPIGANSPVGLVIKPDVVNGKPQPGGEWVMNVGGNPLNYYINGIQIPINVIVFGLLGGYLRYLYGVRWMYGSEKIEEKEWGDIGDDSRWNDFRHSLRALSLFFIAPILAVAVWGLLFSGTTNKFTIATVSFTIGLVTDEVILKLIEFTRSILKGIKGSSNAALPSPSPSPTRSP
jgi:hypothetical protein